MGGLFGDDDDYGDYGDEEVVPKHVGTFDRHDEVHVSQKKEIYALPQKKEEAKEVIKGEMIGAIDPSYEQLINS